jgi:small subunit ribosomal protein S26e
MPISEAPYTRHYEHTKSRGHEGLVTCGYCGRQVPRYKTFTKFRGFRITDPTVLAAIDRQFIHTFSQKMYVCPSCARFHKIVQRGKTRQKSHLGR